MALIIETGVGVRDANAYVPTSYVTNYLTARNRQTENGWAAATDAAREAAIIAATDYVDKRFGEKFRGLPAITFTETYSDALFTFSGQPVVGEELQLGDETYRFVAALTGDLYEVLIGATPDLTAFYLETSINGYGVGWSASRHAVALATGLLVGLVALAPGSGGSQTVLEGPLTNVAFTSFSGGQDGGLQPLAFPRVHAYDRHGVLILGVPDRLKQAVSEYAVRAVDEGLLPDPTTDSFGGTVTTRREVVGPIQEEYKYASAGGIFTSYPSADRLLRPLLIGSGSGGVIRA